MQVASELAKFDAEPLLYVGTPALVNISSTPGTCDNKLGDWKQRFNKTLQVRGCLGFGRHVCTRIAV